MRTNRWFVAAVVLSMLSAGCSGGTTATSTTPSTVPTAGVKPKAGSSTEPSKSAQSLDSAGDKKVNFKFQIKRGMQVAYVIKTTTTSKGAANGSRIDSQMSYTAKVRQKVTSVQPNGDVGIEMSYEFSSVKVDGKSVKAPPARHFEVLMSKTGEVKEIAGKKQDAADAAQAYSETLSQLPLQDPGRPVNVGETWRVDKDVPLPKNAGVVGVHAGYKLKWVSSSKGHRTASVSSQFSVPATITALDPGYIVDSTSTYDGVFEGVISLEDGTMEKGRLKATVNSRGMSHLSKFGIPFYNSRFRITVDQRITKIQHTPMAQRRQPRYLRGMVG